MAFLKSHKVTQHPPLYSTLNTQTLMKRSININNARLPLFLDKEDACDINNSCLLKT